MASPEKGIASVEITQAAEDLTTSEGCSAPFTALDLAALSEGNLSKEGLRRLASHVHQCPTCMTVFASLINESSMDNDDHEIITQFVANGNGRGACVGCPDE